MKTEKNRLHTCPFCHMEVSIGGCCWNKQYKYFCFYIDDYYMRIMLDGYNIYHFPHSNDPNSPRTAISHAGKTILKLDHVLDIDYSDLNVARKKLHMILSFA